MRSFGPSIAFVEPVKTRPHSARRAKRLEPESEDDLLKNLLVAGPRNLDLVESIRRADGNRPGRQLRAPAVALDDVSLPVFAPEIFKVPNRLLEREPTKPPGLTQLPFFDRPLDRRQRVQSRFQPGRYRFGFRAHVYRSDQILDVDTDNVRPAFSSAGNHPRQPTATYESEHSTLDDDNRLWH